jgi:hypothetical protein
MLELMHGRGSVRRLGKDDSVRPVGQPFRQAVRGAFLGLVPLGLEKGLVFCKQVVYIGSVVFRV